MENVDHFRAAELKRLAWEKTKEQRIQFDSFEELKGASALDRLFFLSAYHLYSLYRLDRVSEETAARLLDKAKEDINQLATELPDDNSEFCVLHSRLAISIRQHGYRKALQYAMRMLDISNTPQDSIDFVALFEYEDNAEESKLD